MGYLPAADADLMPVETDVSQLTSQYWNELGRQSRRHWALAGSQPDHAFPETDRYERTQEDTTPAGIEFRGTRKEPAGHGRTRIEHGSGP